VDKEEHAVNTAPLLHHYNPDWLSDDDLVSNFVARSEEFTFLRNELARTPGEGSVQHYLLVGVRGSGKTTLLKRLAVAIRREEDLSNHLIALSFPEELYQVKHLADFWWAACEALADELDRLGRTGHADSILDAVERAKGSAPGDPVADNGLRLLLRTCAELARRPVLLVDNLDMVFRRIGAEGRKRKNPHAPAYWALREALSTTTSPIVIGGSVRLSEPFTDYDKAFYDFFIPKRLGKLTLEEAHRVLERLAEVRGLPEVRERLRARSGHIEALHELTGGNPRALGLIFELLRQGPNSRAVEDFESLMDRVTPYYKARFEDLADQAQVVMHSLAVRRPGLGGDLRFGHSAAEIASHAGLSTGTVSAQLDSLEREGLVEKSAAHGRTQYRVAEQLFRLWLQMRGNRRIRQNVIWLTEFLEALFEPEEIQYCLRKDSGGGLHRARLAFAVAEMRFAQSQRRGLMAYGTESALEHTLDQGGAIEEYLPEGDLPEDLGALMRLRERLGRCADAGLSTEEKDYIIGSIALSPERKETSVLALCSSESAGEEIARLRASFANECRDLIRMGLLAGDLPLLFRKRARGFLPLPGMRPGDAEAGCFGERDLRAYRAMLWRLLGIRKWIRFASDEDARDWLAWGEQHAAEASATEWANVAGTMRRSLCFYSARQALDQAWRRGGSATVWYEHAALLNAENGNPIEVEAAYRKAIEIEPAFAWAWNDLGNLLKNKFNRFEEAEAAYRKAIEIDPADASSWYNLGNLLQNKLNRFEEAEAAYRKAIEIDPADATPWNNLGELLASQGRLDEAESAYDHGAKLEPNIDPYWRKQRLDLQTRICVEALRRALDAGNVPELGEALGRFSTESIDLAAALVSKQFVEDFMAPVLKDAHQSEVLLVALRARGYDRYARPLLLAFEAALTNRPHMLKELEPEVQTASHRIFERLTGKTFDHYE
jgi:tetratricopeptide (TPR) repeat protein